MTEGLQRSAGAKLHGAGFALAGLALAACLFPAAAGAADATLAIPLAPGAERIEARYDCGAFGRIDAAYYNAGEDHLAVVALPEGARIFAGVIAASGARYAAGPYIWWTKGGEASLYDLTKGGEDTPLAVCRAL